MKWDWAPTLEEEFQGRKHIIKCTQALHALDPASPCELDVHVTQEGFGWGLWQHSERLQNPQVSVSNNGKEQRYSTPLLQSNRWQCMLPR